MMTDFRRRLAAALLLAALAAPFAAAPTALAAVAAAENAPAPAAAPSTELTARLDTLFREAYPAGEPGATVLVRRGGEVLLRAGYGIADLEMGVPMRPEMVLRIGSVTKQFTAAAALMLAAEGRLDLDAPLSRYLPDYAGPGAGVTVEQLMTHVSGIPSATGGDPFGSDMRRDSTPDETIATFRDLPLDFPTGTRWSYNNSAYVVLGAILEQVSGKPWAQLLDERIFAPLGMEHTGQEDPERIVPGRVEGYEPAPGGGYRNAPYLSMTRPYAAGALESTVDDLARWNRALAAGEVLPAAWRDRLWTTARLADGRATNYGYGFQLGTYEGHQVIHHGGGIHGFVSHVLWVPEADLFVAVLSNNRSKGNEPLAVEAAALVLGRPLDGRAQVELAPESLDEYVGVYEVNGDPEDLRLVTREGGQLFTRRTGGSKVAVRFAAADRFYFPDSLAHGRFVRDAAGRVAGMELTPSSGADDAAVKTGRPLPVQRVAVAVDPAAAAALLGRYELQPGFAIEVTREGDALYTQPTGQARRRILPESPTRWFFEEIDATIEFRGTEDGTADALVLVQGGREIVAPRID